MTNQKTLNNITGNAYSDEWYTDQATVDVCLEILSPSVASTVLCPFDSGHSLFVQTLLNRGNRVIFGISDFLSHVHYEFDYLVTNPPFSLKDRVIQKCYEYGKKSVLILPLDSLGGVKRHGLFNQYGTPDVYIPTRRIGFYDESGKKRDGANFHSIIMTLNHGAGEGRFSWERKTEDWILK